MATPNYHKWSKEELIKHILQLEKQKAANKAELWRLTDEFDFSAYSTRKIALKFCYSGWEYNGLAYQSKPTPLPTVEAVLFDALARARLIDPSKGFEGCGWAKCGRTDRGVSAADQVVSLYVRTALVGRTEKPVVTQSTGDDGEDDMVNLFGVMATNASRTKKRPVVEHDYPGILNRLLPDTIRVLAWSPVAPTFSARHNCTHRHYKYFFSSIHLDIPAMRTAASYLVGLHDFRNLCKIDAQKQITVFMRRIMTADIVPLQDEPDMFVLNLIGSAFLYHQVRHIMAILFLVGRQLEPPEIIKQMLNVTEGAEDDATGTLEVMPSKPEYQMADGLPLMLWECGFSDTDVSWRTGSQKVVVANGRGVFSHLHEIHERSRVYTTLNKHFLAKAEDLHHERREVALKPSTTPFGERWAHDTGVDIFFGAGAFRRVMQYVPIMLRHRNDTVEVTNERWRIGKGKRREMQSENGGDRGDDSE